MGHSTEYIYFYRSEERVYFFSMKCMNDIFLVVDGVKN